MILNESLYLVEGPKRNLAKDNTLLQFSENSRRFVTLNHNTYLHGKY